jgi:hypothetical protein
MPEAIPTTVEELERKTLDLMIDLAERSEKGDIDPLVAASMCKATWLITSGLVSNDLCDQLATLADQIGPQPVRIFFIGKGRTLRLSYMPLSSGWALQNIDSSTGVRTVLKASKSDGHERSAELAALIEGLKSSGFTRH